MAVGAILDDLDDEAEGRSSGDHNGLFTVIAEELAVLNHRTPLKSLRQPGARLSGMRGERWAVAFRARRAGKAAGCGVLVGSLLADCAIDVSEGLADGVLDVGQVDGVNVALIVLQEEAGAAEDLAEGLKSLGFHQRRHCAKEITYM